MKTGSLPLTRKTMNSNEIRSGVLAPWPGQLHNSSDSISIDDSCHHICIRVHAEGFMREHYSVKIINGIMVITAENKDLTGPAKDYDGYFIRSFRLPENTDEALITAYFVDNMLEVYFPKQASGLINKDRGQAGTRHT